MIIREALENSQVIKCSQNRHTCTWHSHFCIFKMYPKLTADVEPSVANLLQATDELREEILYEGDLELRSDDSGNITGVCGNWYQLEWAWYKIECFMEHQTRMQRRVARTNMVRQMSKEENPSVKSDSAHAGRSVKADEKVLFREKKKTLKFRNDQKADWEIAGHPEKRASKVETQPFQPVHSRGDLDTDRSVMRQAPQPPQAEVESPGPLSVEGPDKGCFRSYREQRQFQSDSDSDDHLPQSSKIGRKGNERTHNWGNAKDGTKHVKEALEREIDPVEAQPDLAVDLHGKAQSKGPPFLNTLSIINDNPNDVKCIEFQYGPLNVSVYMGLITLEETDVIVNAAMGSLFHGGGVARAIADAAGSKLIQECDEYVKTHGSVRTSSAMHTCAGGSLNQKVKHIIHAVGPVWGTRSDADRCLRDLTQTFLNSFLYGNDKLKIKSLAVPLISSGT